MIEHSVVDGNIAEARAAVPSTFPTDLSTEAVGGGIRITEGAAARITDTTIGKDEVRLENTGGDAQATSGGLDVDGSCERRRRRHRQPQRHADHRVDSGDGQSWRRRGRRGLAIGGGILNVDFGGGPPELILRESVVTANQLTASSGITPWVAASSAPISPARSRCRSR